MKTQVKLVSLFIVLQVAVVSSAQVPSSPANSFNPSYSSRIYEVGSTELPSDAYNPFGVSRPVPLAETTEQRDNSGLRTGHGNSENPDSPDYGQTDYSPVGEPYILALFALLFAAFAVWRRTKTQHPTDS